VVDDHEHSVLAFARYGLRLEDTLVEERSIVHRQGDQVRTLLRERGGDLPLARPEPSR